MIVIVDYGVGNLGAIRNMLDTLGHASAVSSDPTVITGASKLILPGVGAFDRGMQQLGELGLIDVLKDFAASGRPMMGICLGMQMLARGSEEGRLPGLGLIEADVMRFRQERFAGQRLRIPHMGWNIAQPARPHPLFPQPEAEQRFYFVHSYYMRCDRPEDILTTTTYGHEFVSGVAAGNVIGFQFHPEKSHKFGMALFRRFAEVL